MYNFSSLRSASRALAELDAQSRSLALHLFAELISSNASALIEASREDYQEHHNVLSSANASRLLLNDDKLYSIVQGVRQLAEMIDPIGRIQDRTELDTELVLERISVPLGVFGIIFESRADVAPQILSLALRSGNAVILKGGRETQRVNSLYGMIADQLHDRLHQLPKGWFQMHHERSVVDEMLKAVSEIDLIIPRGSNELVRSIKERSLVPVLSHADGVCHLYVHESANLEQAICIAIDSKTQYPAACNALETVLVDHSIASEFIPTLMSAAKAHHIELRGCPQFLSFMPYAQAVEGELWHTEYGENILAVKIVSGYDEAKQHIELFGSHHTDVIAAQDHAIVERFLRQIDSASVFSNCSTRFADGFRYGLGAEIGISTGRVHARGPVGIEGLMTYKYLVRGNGQLVASYSGLEARKFVHRKLSI